MTINIEKFLKLFDEATPASDVAAVILEPLQGEGGFIPGPIEFVKRLRKICDDNGIMLIADEVQCGNCRTGKYFASEYWKEAGDNAGYSGKVICADSFYCKHTQMRIYQCHRISQNKAKYCGKRTNQNPACIKRSAHREHNIKQSNPQTTRNPKPLSRNNTLYHWISDGSKQHTYGYGDSKNR